MQIEECEIGAEVYYEANSMSYKGRIWSLTTFEAPPGTVQQVVRILNGVTDYIRRPHEIELVTVRDARLKAERELAIKTAREEKYTPVLKHWDGKRSNRDIAKLAGMTTDKVRAHVKACRKWGMLPDLVSGTIDDPRTSITADGTVRVD